MNMEIDLEKVELSVVEQTSVIANNIRNLRKSTGITQQDLAICSRMDKNRISDIENGRAPNMTIYTLTKIAMVFDVKASDLMRNWQTKNPE